MGNKLANVQKCIRLKDIDNREKLANEAFDSKIQSLEKMVESFVQTETRIAENLKSFRTDMTKASENEYKILQTKCRDAIVESTKQVEEIKAMVVEVIEDFEIQLMHWQVYQEFGFESGVATAAATAAFIASANVGSSVS